jgi:hypothetical protein
MEGGLELEKQTSIPVEAELFFLTSLFIELIEVPLPDLAQKPPWRWAGKYLTL